MGKNVKTTGLMEIKENGIWSKIKTFFKRVFYRKNEKVEMKAIVENKEEKTNVHMVETSKTGISFVQNTNKELLELQKKYRSGEIKEKDLTREQIKELCALYDKQIKELRASNEVRKQRLLKYREKMIAVKA